LPVPHSLNPLISILAIFEIFANPNGAGRKPKGEFSRPESPFSFRMPAVMRSQLEAAASANGRSASQELLRRMQDSFYRDRDNARDPALRALCFVIAELAHSAVGYHKRTGFTEQPMFDWRSHPFFYRAFKIAVTKLLDALEPKGEIQPPKMLDLTLALEEEEPGSLQWRWLQSYKTPEDRGQVAAEYVWGTLQRYSQSSPIDRERELESLKKEVGGDVGTLGEMASDLPKLYPQLSSDDYERMKSEGQRILSEAKIRDPVIREFYGLTDAARDLQIKEEKS
jgi:hypothetical protein